MADAVAVGAVLDLAALELGDSLGDVHGDGAQLGVGHHAAGAQDLAQAADLGHHVRGGDSGVEVDLALLDLCDQVVRTNNLSAGSAGLVGLGALGEDGDADGLAGAVGQGDGTADLLVCLAGVDTQAEVGLDGLIVVCEGDLLSQLDSGHGGVQVLGHLLGGLDVLLSVLRHFITSSW